MVIDFQNLSNTFFFFFSQLCQVGGLTVGPNRNEPNLARGLFKNPTQFSRPLRTPCLNMVTFNFFLSQNMMTFEYFFYKNPLLNFHCVFLFGAKVRKFAKNKNAAVQDVKRTWKYIRSGNRCLGGGYCLYMAKPLVACRYTQWPSPRDWLCT